MGKTIAEIKAERGIGGPPMLHGSDVPAKQNHFKVICKELREAPKNFNSPAIMDFEKEVFGKTCMAINMTNIRALASIAGFEDADNADFDKIAAKLKGKTIDVSVALVNNPKINKMTRSIFFEVEE